MDTQLSDTAVKDIILQVYDTHFTDMDLSLRDVLIQNMDTGPLSSEIQTYAKGMVYHNWNYHLLSGYEARITGIADAKSDEEKDAGIASLVLRSFRLMPKIFDIINHEQKKNTIKDLLEYHSKRMVDTTVSDVARNESSDLVQKIKTDPGDVDELVSEHRKAVLKEKDVVMEEAADKLLNQHNYTKSEWAAEVTRLNTEFADVNSGLKIGESFANQSHALKAAVSSGAHNAFSLTTQVAGAVQTALAGGDQSLESYFATSGYLAEATLGLTGDGATALKHTKVADVSKGAASVALVAAGAASFASVAKMLDDPKLSSEHRKMIEAEVGLQGTALALGAIESGMSIAETLVKAGSKAASVLGKAIPVIGALGSVIGAINPAKWAEFDQKEDRIDALKNADTFSSGMLADLLGESLTIQKAFYGTTTGLNVATGVGSAALAATGVGAPIAAAVGIIGGAISAIVGAFEQVALDELAKEYYNKITTDENGNKRSVEQYFEGSFDAQQEKTKARYEDYFDALTADGKLGQVYALGSQKLSATDLSLAAITKAADELGKTAKHYFETYMDDGGWTKTNIQVETTTGDDTIHLPNANGIKSYVAFTSPLFASGTETLSRESKGKNEHATTLKITDLSGWVVNDQGDNETTFDLDKIVTSAESMAGRRKVVDFTVDANGGDDTMFGYEAGVTFNGGSGVDTASYARLTSKELSEGLTIQNTSATELVVTKHLNEGSKLYKESINTHTENHGKNTEIVQYRAVSLTENPETITTTDKLSDIEIIHGSVRNDFIDVNLSSQITQIFGFGGDDIIKAGDSVRIISGGAGNDVMEISQNVILRALTAKTDNDLVYIDGGEGYDLLKLSQDSYKYMEDLYETYVARQTLSRDIAEKLTVADIQDREGVVDALTDSLTRILENGSGEGVNALQLANTEQVFLNLADTKNGSSTFDVRTYDLNHNANVLKYFGVTSVKPDGTVDGPDIGVSAANVGGAVRIIGTEGHNRIVGSSFDDLLIGDAGDDVLEGGAGNDLLSGGRGKETYVFNQQDHGHDLVTFGANAIDAKYDILEINASSSFTPVYLRDGNNLVVKITDTNSVTVANYFQKLPNVSQSGTVNSNVEKDKYPNVFADVNGDGYTDLINFGYYHVQVALGQEDGSFGSMADALSSFDFSTYGGWYESSYRTAADVNGDGRADLIGLTEDGYRVALGQEDGTFQMAKNTSTGTARQNVENDKYPNVFADVNGDGMADHVWFAYNDTIVSLGQSDGSFGDGKSAGLGSEFTTYWGWYNGSYRTAADVNGDGRADLIGFTEDGYQVALGQEDGTFQMAKNTSRAKPRENVENDKYPNVFADVNGDGMADHVWFAYNDTIVSLGQSDGSFGDGKSTGLGSEFTTYWGWYNGSYRTAADINGDGRADLIGLTSNGVPRAYLSMIDGSFRPTYNDTVLNSIKVNKADGTSYVHNSDYIWSQAVNNFVPGDGQTSGNEFATNYREFLHSGQSWADIDVSGDIPVNTRTSHIGSDKADTLAGTSGKDEFIGGAGEDTLTGNGGADIFVFDRNDNILDTNSHDTITDFGSDDLIVLRNFGDLDFNDVSFIDRSDGRHDFIQINFGGVYQEIYINGLDVSQLTAKNFRFVDATMIEGTSGNDILRGTSGANTLSGGDGNDIIHGNDNADIIFGGNGRDTIYGGGGDDFIHGGSGLDTLDGGEGFDIASYNKAGWAIKFDLNGEQTEHYKVDNSWLKGDSVANFEGVAGSNYADVLIGNESANFLQGNGGADVISGNGGNDTINGGDGHDTIDGGAGNDVLSGGTGNDTFVFNRNDNIATGSSLDTIKDFSADDKIIFKNYGDLGFDDLSFNDRPDDDQNHDSISINFNGVDQEINIEGLAISALTAVNFEFV